MSARQPAEGGRSLNGIASKSSRTKGADPRSLSRCALEHALGDVTRSDVVAQLEPRQEALAGPASDVEHPPAGEPVRGGELSELGEPALTGDCMQR